MEQAIIEIQTAAHNIKLIRDKIERFTDNGEDWSTIVNKDSRLLTAMDDLGRSIIEYRQAIANNRAETAERQR